VASQYPSDLARRRNNQRLIAERTGWPTGALEACVELEDRHPGWFVHWMPENTAPGFERPAGFDAEFDHVEHRTRVSGPTVEAIEPLLVEVPDHDYSVRGCEWCRARF